MDGRVEYKYLVPNSLLDDIRDEIAPYVRPDALGGKGDGVYTVRSIYYDTPRLQCYDTKLDGLTVRAKYRIRGYDQPDADSIVFLEIKRKYANYISKNRAPLRLRDLEAFLTSPDIDRYILQLSGTPTERRDAERFLYHYYSKSLIPTVLVVYDREAFFGRYDKTLRITFDKSLRRGPLPSLETLYDEHSLDTTMANTWIFEVKFFRNTLPGFVRSIVSRYRLPRLALSKYAMCLEAAPPIPVLAARRAVEFTAASRRL